MNAALAEGWYDRWTDTVQQKIQHEGIKSTTERHIGVDVNPSLRRIKSYSARTKSITVWTWDRNTCFSLSSQIQLVSLNHVSSAQSVFCAQMWSRVPWQTKSGDHRTIVSVSVLCVFTMCTADLIGWKWQHFHVAFYVVGHSLKETSCLLICSCIYSKSEHHTH